MTDRQTDARGKTICLPTLKGGDIISANLMLGTSTCTYDKHNFPNLVHLVIINNPRYEFFFPRRKQRRRSAA